MKTDPVRLLLIRNDKSQAIVIADETAIKLQPKIIRSEGIMYEYRGDDKRDGVWVKLFHETQVLDL
jgi:hypothetical protein